MYKPPAEDDDEEDGQNRQCASDFLQDIFLLLYAVLGGTLLRFDNAQQNAVYWEESSTPDEMRTTRLLSLRRV